MTPGPADASQSSPWLVGKDKDGRWIVRDRLGQHGGIFVDRTAALHFALFENGRHGAIMVSGILGLDVAAGSTL